MGVGHGVGGHDVTLVLPLELERGGHDGDNDGARERRTKEVRLHVMNLPCVV